MYSKKLYLVGAQDYKSITFALNNQIKVSQSPYSSQWLLPNGCLVGSFFVAMIKTRGAFRTQPITLTTHLGYPGNYFLKKASS